MPLLRGHIAKIYNSTLAPSPPLREVRETKEVHYLSFENLSVLAQDRHAHTSFHCQPELMEKTSLNMLFASSQESRGFPGGAGCKEPTCQCRRCKRHRFDPWVRKIPWRRKTATHSSIPAGKFQGLKSPAGYSPWGHKESDTAEQSCVAAHPALDDSAGQRPLPWGAVTLTPAWPSGSRPRLQHSRDPSCHPGLPLTQPET